MVDSISKQPLPALQVTAISTRKDEYSDIITHIWCGEESMDVAQAVFEIRFNNRQFYTNVNGSMAKIVPVEANGRSELRTIANGTTTDNLRHLPRKEAPFNRLGP